MNKYCNNKTKRANNKSTSSSSLSIKSSAYRPIRASASVSASSICGSICGWSSSASVFSGAAWMANRGTSLPTLCAFATAIPAGPVRGESELRDYRWGIFDWADRQILADIPGRTDSCWVSIEGQDSVIHFRSVRTVLRSLFALETVSQQW